MLKIRLMQKDDIPRVLEIETSVFPHTSWAYNSFLNEISSEISFPYVLLFNNKIVGYIIFHIIYPEAHITNFAIAKEHQNKGLGKCLLEFAINKIKEKKVKSIFLEVRVSNIRAQYIYKKFGFKFIGIRENYYQNNNESAIIMALFF